MVRLEPSPTNQLRASQFRQSLRDSERSSPPSATSPVAHSRPSSPLRPSTSSSSAPAPWRAMRTMPDLSRRSTPKPFVGDHRSVAETADGLVGEVWNAGKIGTVPASQRVGDAHVLAGLLGGRDGSPAPRRPVPGDQHLGVDARQGAQGSLGLGGGVGEERRQQLRATDR